MSSWSQTDQRCQGSLSDTAVAPKRYSRQPVSTKEEVDAAVDRAQRVWNMVLSTNLEKESQGESKLGDIRPAGDVSPVCLPGIDSTS